MSTFGKYFRVTTFGESHCKAVGVIVDSPPPGMELSASDVQKQLSRRRPGQSDLSTPRNEYDQVEIMSGTEAGLTLGTPLCMMVWNRDQRPQDYSGQKQTATTTSVDGSSSSQPPLTSVQPYQSQQQKQKSTPAMEQMPRPSHADLTYLEKYGVKASSGGGRSSARETIGRVAAGAVAELYLKQLGIDIVAFVSSVGQVHVPQKQVDKYINGNQQVVLTREDVDRFDTRCPHKESSDLMRQLILQQKQNKDSVGGSITCILRNAPCGLGEPAFDKLEAVLAHAMLSIPSTKAFEIGSGFAGAASFGSQHNDMFELQDDRTGRCGRPELNGSRLGTSTNKSGGVQGGISNGETIYFKVGFKPPATIALPQQTAQYNNSSLGSSGDSCDDSTSILENKGRHDPCVVPRAVAIVESMAALVLMDAVMAQMSRCALTDWLPSLSQKSTEEDGSKDEQNTVRKLMTVGWDGKPHPWWKAKQN
ncbi:hypothetical protein MIR68_000451 [Amoeboaphelidium protococcarum]|nr:hypothetical protein MIR68_000451 [Amoeboaphelidium protococcarum]